jgi:hypothetical protein
MRSLTGLMLMARPIHVVAGAMAYGLLGCDQPCQRHEDCASEDFCFVSSNASSDGSEQGTCEQVFGARYELGILNVNIPGFEESEDVEPWDPNAKSTKVVIRGNGVLRQGSDNDDSLTWVWDDTAGIDGYGGYVTVHTWGNDFIDTNIVSIGGATLPIDFLKGDTLSFEVGVKSTTWVPFGDWGFDSNDEFVKLARWNSGRWLTHTTTGAAIRFSVTALTTCDAEDYGYSCED